MKRDTENRLLEFCVQQQTAFSRDAWAQFAVLSELEKATVARFLAGVGWYGSREELARFADTVTSANFAELSRATNFDASRFSGLLKAHLAHAARTK
jgi:hypothetical protein